MRTQMVLLALTLCCGAAHTAHAQDTYHFVSLDIPNTRGQTDLTSLSDINDLGDIVAGSVDSSGPGVLLMQPFTQLELHCPGEDAILPAQPQGVNNHGEVVGFRTVNGSERPFFRDRARKRQPPRLTLIDVPQAVYLVALGLNDLGWVVGSFADHAGVSHGFVFRGGTTLRVIDVPRDFGMSTGITGINNRGDMVGGYVDAAGAFRGFSFVRGRFARLDVPGAVFTGPADINDSGLIGGIYAEPPAGFTFLKSFVVDEGDPVAYGQKTAVRLLFVY